MKNIRKKIKNADVFQNIVLTIFSAHSTIWKRLRKTIKNADEFINKEAEAMKTRAECLEKYGSDYFIEKKIKEGELFKVGKGIYSEKKYVPEIAMFVYKYPNAVVTMKSAFYFHGLTDVIPDECDLATTRDATKIKDERVKQYFIPDDFFAEGIEIADYKGYDIRIYNKERMLIELVRYKSKLPFDYYKEIILNYRKLLPRLDIQKIQDYALMAPKSNKVLEILQMEVL